MYSSSTHQPGFSPLLPICTSLGPPVLGQDTPPALLLSLALFLQPLLSFACREMEIHHRAARRSLPQTAAEKECGCVWEGKSVYQRQKQRGWLLLTLWLLLAQPELSFVLFELRCPISKMRA